MSSFTPTLGSLPQNKVDNIFHVVRRANAHFARVAARYRNSFRPTHHARKHAHSLKLSINTQAASKLDQRQISILPLPILDLVPSPVFQVTLERQAPIEAIIVSADAPRPRIVAPIPRYASDLNTLRLKGTERPAKPLISTEPIIVDGPENTFPFSVHSSASPCRGLTSRWSASTIEAEEAGQEADEMLDAVDVSESAPIRVKYFSGNDESLDILVSPDNDQPPVARNFQSEVRPQCNVRPTLPVSILRGSPTQRIELDLDRQASSSSSDSSVGLVTPLTSEELPKLMIRLKRKSLIDDADIDDLTDDRPVLEKRPKYDRKRWVNMGTERRGHGRNSSWSHHGKYI